MKGRCETCPYWHEIKLSYGSGQGVATANCRRNPPVLNIYEGRTRMDWPVTRGYDGCGEHPANRNLPELRITLPPEEQR